MILIFVALYTWLGILHLLFLHFLRFGWVFWQHFLLPFDQQQGSIHSSNFVPSTSQQAFHLETEQMVPQVPVIFLSLVLCRFLHFRTIWSRGGGHHRGSRWRQLRLAKTGGMFSGSWFQTARWCDKCYSGSFAWPFCQSYGLDNLLRISIWRWIARKWPDHLSHCSYRYYPCHPHHYYHPYISC